VPIVRAGGSFGVVEVHWNASVTGINLFYLHSASVVVDLVIYRMLEICLAKITKNANMCFRRFILSERVMAII